MGDLIKRGACAVASGLAFTMLVTGCGANNDAGTPVPIPPPDAVATEPADPTEPAEPSPATPGDYGPITLVTTNSFAISDETIAAFLAETGSVLNIVPVGSAGVLANQLVLTRNSPLGDVFFGVDNTFASRLLTNEVTEPFTPSNLPISAERYVLGNGALTPVTQGDVCLNIDLNWFAEHNITAPERLEDLLDPVMEGQTVVLNPAQSSPGMAFLLATIAAFGDETDAAHLAPADGRPASWQDYWRQLLANDALIADSWSQGYFSDFSGAGEGGTRPIVVSYSSSPASTLNEAGTATTTAALMDTCFRQIEYAGVLAGAANPEGAQRLIEFLVSEQFQSDLPTQMWVYPIDDAVALPDDWAHFTHQAEHPLYLSAEAIETNRERWLESWLQLALQ